MIYEAKQFPNIGYVTTVFTNEQLDPIRKEVEKVKNNFDNADTANHRLVGHLKHEFNLSQCKPYLEDLLRPLVIGYTKEFNLMEDYNLVNDPTNLFLDSVWVNFQQKHEFNPIHYHSGLLSFALWLSVPYNSYMENNLYPNVNGGSQTSAFCFHYTSSIGDIKTQLIHADETYENRVVMFPSRLRHSVNPFYTSDGFRISISGNFLVRD